MRHHVSLFLTVSFLFLGHGVQASSIDDDNASVTQGAAVNAVTAVTAVTSSTSEDLQCYRKINGQLEPMFDDGGKLLDLGAQERGSDDTMSFVEKDGKKLWTNVLSSLAHHVRVGIMEWLQDNPRGQLSLMTVSQGFRRLALVMPQRSNDAVSTGNSLKKWLFTVLIGGQTGDLDLFIQDQLKAFQKLSLQDLQDAFASRYYAETLSPTREHGKTYRSIGPGDIKRGIWGEPKLSLVRKNLRLVPLNFPEASTILGLDLSENQLRVLPDLIHLTNLRWLDLSNNQLKAAPVVTGLTKLLWLDLSNNQLKAAPVVTGLTKLLLLKLSNNQLKAAPDVSGLTELAQLDLSNNQLSAAPVLAGLTKLEWLYLSENQITAAPDVSGLTNLERLVLANNQLINAPDVSGLMKLKLLYLDSYLCGDPTLLKTLRDMNSERDYSHMNSERDYSHKIWLVAISKDDAGDMVITHVSLD